MRAERPARHPVGRGGAPWPRSFVATERDRGALLVLSALHGFTPRRLMALAARHGTASATLSAIRHGRAGGDHDRRRAASLDAASIEAAIAASGAEVVPWGAPGYPPQLMQIPDPPAVLYVIGALPPDVTRAVAVVGARRCSALGRELAFDVGRTLAAAGIVVVSGAARGIDAAAHEGALSVGGSTLAVMGCGIDTVYPAGSRELVERIRERGTVISEYPPGTPAFQRNFPARNRIVAGLSGAVVVVEGAAGSGSMISAEHAIEFGRDVYAVPGAVTDPLAAVPLQLIRDGATLIRGAVDLVADLGVADDGPATGRLELSEGERRALAALDGPTLPERVARALGATIPEAVGVLMRLELRGLVRSAGGRYEPTLGGVSASATAS